MEWKILAKMIFKQLLHTAYCIKYQHKRTPLPARLHRSLSGLCCVHWGSSTLPRTLLHTSTGLLVYGIPGLYRINYEHSASCSRRVHSSLLVSSVSQSNPSSLSWRRCSGVRFKNSDYCVVCLPTCTQSIIFHNLPCIEPKPVHYSLRADVYTVHVHIKRLTGLVSASWLARNLLLWSILLLFISRCFF
jgi:hypothetical protein